MCCLSCCIFLSFVFFLCHCLLLASGMAEYLCCFQNCSRNSVCRLVFSLAFTYCRQLMKPGKIVIEKSLSYMLLLMVPEQVWDWYCCSYCFRFLFCFSFLGPLFSVFSFLLWDSLWLVEEVLTLLCLLLIMRMEIS